MAARTVNRDQTVGNSTGGIREIDRYYKTKGTNFTFYNVHTF